MSGFRIIKRVALVAALFVPTLAMPQKDPSREELQRQVGAALSNLLGDSSRTVVDKLKGVKPDGAISANFDLAKVSRALFGRVSPKVAPDCRSTSTPAREPDEGTCVVDAGDRDSETGAYQSLMFSKNIGIGDIKYARRAPFDPKSVAMPTPVKLDDAQAYLEAMKFLDLVGVPRSEVPALPQGVAPPVRALAVGTVDERGNKLPAVQVMKVVSIPRAFVVPGGLLKDPATGRELNHVLAPGNAVIGVDDAGVQMAMVNGWSDAQMDPKVDPARAKSTAVLTNEIVDDLYAEGVRQVGTLSMLVVLRRAYPNPDDPNPPLCPVCGWLIPAVQVIVSQAGADRGDTSEKAWAAPGVIREYDLVEPSVERPSR